MTNPFATPSTASGVDLKDLLGSLLVISVWSVETGINTVHGLSDAIRCDIAVLDGPHAGDEHKDTLLFPRVLQSQLRSNINGKVIGRLGQGVAKPGQTAPWVLAEVTPADVKVGVAWLEARQSNTFSKPSNTDQPPF